MKRRCTGAGTAGAPAWVGAVPLVLLAALPLHAEAVAAQPRCDGRSDASPGPSCDGAALRGAAPVAAVAARAGVDAAAPRAPVPVPVPAERSPPQTLALMLGGLAAMAFVVARRRQD